MTILFDSLTKSKLRQIYHDNFIFRFLYLKKNPKFIERIHYNGWCHRNPSEKQTTNTTNI